MSRKLKMVKEYPIIVVIEDLDRTDDNDAVVNFLKELRKYYVPDSMSGQQCRYRNKVILLSSIMNSIYLAKLDRLKSLR